MANLVEFAPGFSAYTGGEEEARLYFKEIFVDHAYNVVKLPDKAFIIDAGANIGFFTLYMKKKYPSSRILAFEPAPETFKNLSKNIELHNTKEGVEIHECALGSKNTTKTFTFYPNFPGNSTLVPEEKKLALKAAHELSSDMGKDVERMYQNPQEVSVPLRRLSYFLKDVENLTRIDLLKIDVEGVELETLLGLDDHHLALVRNVIIEICDLAEGQLKKLETFLESKGFIIKTEASDWIPKEAKMFMVIGHRETGVQAHM